MKSLITVYKANINFLLLRVYEVLALSCSLRISLKIEKTFKKRISPLSKGKLTSWKLAISFSGILCPTDFLMIEIIYDHRIPLWDSAIRHFIIHKGTIILLSHLLSFYFKHFKVAAVMLVIDLIVKWYKIRMFSGNIIHNCLFETASKIEIFEPEQIALIIYPLKDCFKIRDTGEYRGYEMLIAKLFEYESE